MKKKITLIVTILLLITGCFQSKKEKIDDNQNLKNVPYYKEEYQERYITYKQKNSNLSNEDVITRVNIGLDRPFYTSTKETKDLNKIYILSNKYNYIPNNYIPDNLEEINPDYTNGTKKLVNIARLSFEELAYQAKQDGYTIRAISAYRSYDYQLGLYNKYVAQDGKEQADTYSARPGYSEHQTGLVVDVDNIKTDFNNFESTEEFKWMQENAYKYGFILRYPKGKEHITGYTYESWHYRYVGKEIAKTIHNENFTFDEYYVRFIDK